MVKYSKSEFQCIDVPGDGSCMYHSCSIYLKESATEIRQRLSQYIKQNPDVKLNDTCLKDWIMWGDGMTTDQYAQRTISSGTWGGAMELTLISHIYRVNISVLRPTKDCYVLVSDIDFPNADRLDRMYLQWTGGHYCYLKLV